MKIHCCIIYSIRLNYVKRLFLFSQGVFAFLLSILTSDLVGVEHGGPGFGFLVTVQALGATVGTPAGGKT